MASRRTRRLFFAPAAATFTRMQKLSTLSHSVSSSRNLAAIFALLGQFLHLNVNPLGVLGMLGVLSELDQHREVIQA